VSAEETDKPKPPQDWEMKGIVAALADPYAEVRLEAAKKLAEYQLDDPRSLIKNYKDVVDKLVKHLSPQESDDKEKSVSRRAAASALGQMKATNFAPDVAKLLKDSDRNVRYFAASALGQMKATNIAPQVAALLKDSDTEVQRAAASALGQMKATNIAPQVAPLLKNSDTEVRVAAASALGQMKATNFAPQVAPLLKDSDRNVRGAAAEALPKLGQQGLPTIVHILDAVLQSRPEEIAQPRFLAHFIGGGEQNVETLMQWVGRPKSRPKKLTLQEGRNIIELFDKTWKISESTPLLRQELAEQIAVVAEKVSWKTDDIKLLKGHYHHLTKVQSTHAAAVKSVVDKLEFRDWFSLARNIILIHLVIWLTLILAYPKFPQVLATFFWNPWIRRIGGFGYIGLLLTWVPYLRRRLFEPFKPILLADAGLDNFSSIAYFPQSGVVETRHGASLQENAEEMRPITQAIPSITGQIVLEGDSGLGKSMFLRHLVKTSQQIVAYLPAQKCDNGVIEAIYAKLQGQVQDAKFLRNLIYNGAIDICIDGLNEVTADTRAKISQFAESYFRGNIIMTTQPLDWIPPSTAKKYELQPLEREQIQQFLIYRQQRLLPSSSHSPPYFSPDVENLSPNLSPARGEALNLPPSLVAGLFHSKKENSNRMLWAQYRIAVVRESKPL
jgi:truncated hemoglobin YjbI